MDWSRLRRHLFTLPGAGRRAFPGKVRRTIALAVAAGERRHRGEVRFVIERRWPAEALRRGQTTRERAVELFGQLRVWDTEDNSGVLIYLLLAEHRIEILADRGINRAVGADTWTGICQRMSAAFQAGEFEAGALAGIQEVHDILAAHFPAGDHNPNELPDEPVLI